MSGTFPFKINIETGNGTRFSYYTASFATTGSADTAVSASKIVSKVKSIAFGSLIQIFLFLNH